MNVRFVLLLSSSLIFMGSAQAQIDPAAQATIKAWENLNAKVIEMAKDFPESLFEFQPHPDSRSFLDEIWHISTGNGILAARMRGERPGQDLIQIPDQIKHNRDSMVSRLNRYSKECIDLLNKRFDPRSIQMLAHISEHYGKLVTIYRVNGLVPPNSKDK